MPDSEKMSSFHKLIDDIQNAQTIELILINMKDESSKSKKKKYNLKKVIALKELRDSLKNHVVDWLSSKDNKVSFFDYAFADYNKDEGFRIPAKDVPNFTIIQDGIHEILNPAAEDGKNAIQINELKKFDPNIFAISFIKSETDEEGQLKENEIIIFNNHKAILNAKKNTWACWNETRFELVEDSKVIALKREVDCVYNSRNGEIYILDRNAFEKIFDFSAQIQSKAKKYLDKIEKENAIQGFVEFKNACLNDKTITYSIAKLENHQEVLPYKYLVKKIKKIVEEDKLLIEFNKENKIIFDDKCKDKKIVREILNLLSDGKLKSRVTDRNFDLKEGFQMPIQGIMEFIKKSTSFIEA